MCCSCCYRCSDRPARIEKIGAIAAIICNTTTGSAANAIGGGGVGVQMKISTYMMSDADCKKIKASILAGGVTAELIDKVLYYNLWTRSILG